MTHGVHAVQHEVEHEIKHGDDHGGHKGLLDNINKKVALLIGVLALFLAFSETLGKSAQTGAISYNIEAANLCNGFGILQCLGGDLSNWPTSSRFLPLGTTPHSLEKNNHASSA